MERAAMDDRKAATLKPITMRLPELVDGMYAGFGYERASRGAQEVCEIAAKTGQTMLAADHLAVLAGIMRRGL